jgi:hypothetical protein
MEWKTVQRDFIVRSLKLLEQYDEYSSSELIKNKNFEELDVTLLVNCLTGLLVFPYEYATRDNIPSNVQICKDDSTAIKDLDKKWGLQNINIEIIRDFDHKIVKPSLEATLRMFIYRMRNSISHSRFYDGTNFKSNGLGFIYSSIVNNPIKSKIDRLIFQDSSDRFKAVISITNLRQFAETFAKMVLESYK